MNTNDTFLIGVIVKAQGIKGEVKVKPFTDTPDVLCTLEHVIIDGKKIKIIKSRSDNTMAYLLLDGIANRNMAEDMRSKEIYVDKKYAPQLPKDRYYIDDLIGCQVADDKGKPLGELVDVLINSANDVYVIKKENKEILVPAMKSVVEKIDIDKKLIVLVEKRLKEVAVYDN